MKVKNKMTFLEKTVLALSTLFLTSSLATVSVQADGTSEPVVLTSEFVAPEPLTLSGANGQPTSELVADDRGNTLAAPLEEEVEVTSDLARASSDSGGNLSNPQ